MQVTHAITIINKIICALDMAELQTLRFIMITTLRSNEWSFQSIKKRNNPRERCWINFPKRKEYLRNKEIKGIIEFRKFIIGEEWPNEGHGKEINYQNY